METAKTKRVAIYARVSTADQTPENQLIDLRRYCATRGLTIVKEFVDVGISGAKRDRPALAELMTAVHKRHVDGVLVWRFDRFARSLSHLVNALQEFNEKGVSFTSFSENIDTGTSQGKMVFAVMAAMAEFERDIITERINAGIRRARTQGKRFGRPSLPDDVIAKIHELSAQGLSLSRIASQITWVRASGKYGTRKETNISKAVVGKILKQASTKHRQNVA